MTSGPRILSSPTPSVVPMIPVSSSSAVSSISSTPSLSAPTSLVSESVTLVIAGSTTTLTTVIAVTSVATLTDTTTATSIVPATIGLPAPPPGYNVSVVVSTDGTTVFLPVGTSTPGMVTTGSGTPPPPAAITGHGNATSSVPLITPTAFTGVGARYIPQAALLTMLGLALVVLMV